MTDVVMVLLNNSTFGGTERRFAQLFAQLQGLQVRVALAVNESLLVGLIRAGLVSPDRPPEYVLKEPFGRIARWMQGLADAPQNGFRSQAAFWVRKLDYLLACISIGWWILARRPKALHVILGGAYVVLPLQWLGMAPPAIVSVVCPSLRSMVGSRLGLFLYRRSLRHAWVVDALTARVSAEVHAAGVVPARIRLSPGSCIDTDRFRPAARKRPWVVFAGRLVPEKNPALFLQAVALVHPRFPDARFFVLGDGPLRQGLESLARAYGLNGCLEIGWRDHVEEVLAEALVFASLQSMDNYPSQALLEAMACGTAVVATDVGLTAILVDESVGHRVSPSPDAVAEGIIRLLADPDESVRLGVRARKRVMQDHSMATYLDYLSGLYASAPGMPASPDAESRLVEART